MDNPFEQIDNRLASIESYLKEIVDVLKPRKEELPKQYDEILNIEEAANFLNLSKSTLYQMSSENRIPVSKFGKKLMFSRDELVQHIKKSRKKTKEDIAREVDELILRAHTPKRKKKS
jgi:excisionase family DNA binding protein